MRSSPFNADDSIDGFCPQSGSQWDALGHAITDQGLAYNNVDLDDVLENGRLGIDTLAAGGPVTRGVCSISRATTRRRACTGVARSASRSTPT